MKVFLKEIIHLSPPVAVKFVAEAGEAVAIWEGGEPVIGREYDVEIDIDGTLMWNEEVVQDNMGKCLIEMHNNIAVITGKLESVDHDGYAILRIGNSIIPFLSRGRPFESGSFVKLLAKSLTLTPIAE